MQEDKHVVIYFQKQETNTPVSSKKGLRVFCSSTGWTFR